MDLMDELIVRLVMFEPAMPMSSQPVAYDCRKVVDSLTSKLTVVRFSPACGVIVTVAILYGSSDAEPFAVNARAAPPSVEAT